MTSNSAKVTLEEKIVQRIKETELAALIDDEDSITKLAERAITQALFQPQRRDDGNGWVADNKVKDSPVVAAAREIAEKLVTSLIEERVAALMSDPSVAKEINSALIALFPAVLLDGAKKLAHLGGAWGSSEAIKSLENAGVIPAGRTHPVWWFGGDNMGNVVK